MLRRISFPALVLLLTLAGCGKRGQGGARVSLDVLAGVSPKHVGQSSGKDYFAYELSSDYEKVRASVAGQLAREGWPVKDGDSTFARSEKGNVVDFVAVKKGRLTSDGMNVIPDAKHTVVTIYETPEKGEN